MKRASAVACDDSSETRVALVPLAPPPPDSRRQRKAEFPKRDTKPDRYTLPTSLESPTVVGYRTRVALDTIEARDAALLLDLARPEAFIPGPPLLEQALFEECALGVLSARQSTNDRGLRQITFGTDDSALVAALLARLDGLEAPPHGPATHTHVVVSRPYRTAFTKLLTFAGHEGRFAPWSVLSRAVRKAFRHETELPSIAALEPLHLGILGEGLERAAVVASEGRRAAQLFHRPFCEPYRRANEAVVEQLERLCGLTLADHLSGWRVGLVARVGEVPQGERPEMPRATWRKLGANLLAFRSERLQPGVNQPVGAPSAYLHRPEMSVPPALMSMARDAALTAFARTLGVDRIEAATLLLLETVDVTRERGKARLRDIRRHLSEVTDRLVRELPLWADLATNGMLSRQADRGRKAFALAGQRIVIGGLARRRVEALGLPWTLAVRAAGAAAARASLVAELSGVAGLPSDCDLLAGVCLMAGPVNQNDLAKTFYGGMDLLETAFPGVDATSLLVWTLKAKTVADPVGNEEQLMNPARRGALVRLRPGPHEVVRVASGGTLSPLRRREGRTNRERAFADVGNFVTDPRGREIPGNRGSAWPSSWSRAPVWPSEVSPR
ncbi:MAG: hypothetical protein RL199_123 [Pseudomonadota bacterium]